MATRIEPTVGTTPDGWVSLGVVARSHGLHGALKLHLWHGDSGTSLRPGARVRLGAAEHRVVGYTPTAELLVVEGVGDRDAADRLRGRELLVLRAELPPLQDDEVYLVDLIGRPVVDEEGRALGVVVGTSDNGAQPLLEVSTAQGEVLVPFVPAIVVEVGARVVLRPPGGLFELESGAADADGHDGDPDGDHADE